MGGLPPVPSVQYLTKAKQSEQSLEILCFFALTFAALCLYCLNLGDVALRDWDEATVAQVAKEISVQSPESLRWLFPTLHGQPYLNKPPLIHNLIAGVFYLGGINEFTARIPGALLTALSVPLLYGLAKELFGLRLPALICALTYLTMLPVVRHGRLAMLDGPVLCFGIMTLWAVLRCRRDVRWSVAVGLGLALVGLTKGVMMAGLWGAIAVTFLVWDTPRLLRSFYGLLGFVLGSLPLWLWYGAQWIHYQDLFVTTGLWEQSFSRIFQDVDQNDGPWWYYGLELLKYGWPYLLFGLYGLGLAWQEKSLGWGKLILLWWGISFVSISMMGTKLPWYLLSSYPALALATGAYLTHIHHRLSDQRPYPRSWLVLFSTLTILISCVCFYYLFVIKTEPLLLIILASLALTMAMVYSLISQNNIQFISVLFWGMYISLYLLMDSGYWNWELNEYYPVKPVAEEIKTANIPGDIPIYTSFPWERPSLLFYSDRAVISADYDQLAQYWDDARPAYFLLETKAIPQLSFNHELPQGNQSEWLLIANH